MQISLHFAKVFSNKEFIPQKINRINGLGHEHEPCKHFVEALAHVRNGVGSEVHWRVMFQWHKVHYSFYLVWAAGIFQNTYIAIVLEATRIYVVSKIFNNLRYLVTCNLFWIVIWQYHSFQLKYSNVRQKRSFITSGKSALCIMCVEILWDRELQPFF